MRTPSSHGSPPRPLKNFAAAIGFLTLLPVGRVWADDGQPRSVGWYPWVGWLAGGVVVGPLWALRRLQGPIVGTKALMCAAVTVAAWALLTRFLHWDGLADAADGLWGGHTPASRLEIMRDSRIGSFGAVAMVMATLLQVTAGTLLIERGALWVLVAAPVLARLAAALAAWQLPSARNDGLGLTAMGAPGPYDIVVAGTATLALGVLVPLGVPATRVLVVLAAGLLAGILVPRALARPIGGMTGDLFGATVILVETVVLLIGAVI